jgi:hypothetical protein
MGQMWVVGRQLKTTDMKQAWKQTMCVNPELWSFKSFTHKALYVYYESGEMKPRTFQLQDVKALQLTN